MWKNCNFPFFEHRDKFLKLSILYLVLACIAIYIKGLNLGVDFTGGYHIEILVPDNDQHVSFDKIKSIKNVEVTHDSVNIEKFFIRVKSTNEYQLQIIKDKLKQNFGEKIIYEKIDFIGPQISHVIVQSAIKAIIIALICMFIYLLIRFNIWFAIGGIYALMHDVIVIMGLFCLTQIEFTAITISAILTIIGYSINDTVVIYDRIRENLNRNPTKPIAELVDTAIIKTLTRTTLTSITTLISAVVLLIFGGKIMQDFSFAMMAGIIIGTYSSIFISIFPLRIAKN